MSNERSHLHRRRFLQLGGLSAGISAIGCQSTGQSKAPPSITASQPRVELVHLPTPLETLPNLSEQLGVHLLIKRDDQTGLATGGNKSRKMEYIVAAAQNAAADTLLTTGSLQSNHCRQTAAAAARFDLDCVLLLRGETPTAPSEGNLLLDHLLGADVRYGDQSLDAAAAELEAAGRRPYIVPVGGSNAIGATAYVAAMEETLDQLADRGESVDWMITATGSGGTQGGMALAARVRGYEGHLLGISISREKGNSQSRLAEVANETAVHLGVDTHFVPTDFEVNSDYLGEGYGAMNAVDLRGVQTLARREGILLDPVYTGRAFGGMLELIEKGVIKRGERVLFWHTGGTPALFVDKYAAELQG
ncbi:MAG: D-cysteine desulfhydrase family protein [Planctomycetota bacterium]|jgi:D-cysteine desulfhydrase family pyridoxal phosphate-dependent enzyme